MVCAPNAIYFLHICFWEPMKVQYRLNMFKRALLYFGHKRAAKSTILNLKVKPAGKNKYHYCFRINNVYINVLSLSLGQTR